jgi:hypothetical protein
VSLRHLLTHNADLTCEHYFMKTLASFNQPMDAYLLRARLEGSGIAAYIRDENLITLDWLYSNAVGGVKVDVMDEDYEKALEILDAD